MEYKLKKKKKKEILKKQVTNRASAASAAGAVTLLSIKGFGLFYSLFQLWPMIFDVLANTGVGAKGIKAGFSPLSCPLPAPEAFFHSPKCANKSQVLVRRQWVCLVPPVQSSHPQGYLNKGWAGREQHPLDELCLCPEGMTKYSPPERSASTATMAIQG